MLWDEKTRLQVAQELKNRRWLVTVAEVKARKNGSLCGFFRHSSFPDGIYFHINECQITSQKKVYIGNKYKIEIFGNKIPGKNRYGYRAKKIRKKIIKSQNSQKTSKIIKGDSSSKVRQNAPEIFRESMLEDELSRNSIEKILSKKTFGKLVIDDLVYERSTIKQGYLFSRHFPERITFELADVDENIRKNLKIGYFLRGKVHIKRDNKKWLYYAYELEKCATLNWKCYLK